MDIKMISVLIEKILEEWRPKRLMTVLDNQCPFQASLETRRSRILKLGEH